MNIYAQGDVITSEGYWEVYRIHLLRHLKVKVYQEKIEKLSQALSFHSLILKRAGSFFWWLTSGVM